MSRHQPFIGPRTRAAVTRAAVDRASVEGLTIGGLAGEVEIRKSSVFSLFGSKQDLQLATLESAIEQFKDEVWGPVSDEQPGMPRLLALCDSWLACHEREVMPGDAADVAFQLNTLAAAASYGFQLWRNPEVFTSARRSMRAALGR